MAKDFISCKENCLLCKKAPRTCDNVFDTVIDKGKCGNYCSECGQSSAECNGKFRPFVRQKKYNINFSYFKPYFDVTLGKEVTSKHEITEHCKRNDMVYAGDKELTQQCAQNKLENEAKQEKIFNEGLEKELSKVL